MKRKELETQLDKVVFDLLPKLEQIFEQQSRLMAAQIIYFESANKLRSAKTKRLEKK